MIIGYCRVSTKEQQLNSEALEQQKARVSPHCDRLIVDVESGRSPKRLGFAEIEVLIRRGQCTELVCTRIDRLTRSLGHLQKIIELASKHGCKIHCLDDKFDLSTAAGRFHANIIGSVAEMESAMLAERISHGMAYRRQQLKVNRAPFGYRLNAESRLELDREPFLCLLRTKEAYSRYQMARMLVGWFLDPPIDKNGVKRRSMRRAVAIYNEEFGLQYGKRTRAKQLFDISFTAVGFGHWLKTPTICGHTVYGMQVGKKKQPRDKWQIIRNTHPRIVTEEEEAAIFDYLKKNKRQSFDPNTKKPRALTGLLRCARCGAMLRLESSARGKTPGRNYYYRCPRYEERSCTVRKMIRIEKAERAIVDALVDRAEKIAKWYQNGDPIDLLPAPQEVVELRASLDALEKLPYNPAIESSKTSIRVQIEELLSKHELQSKTLAEKERVLAGLTSRKFWEEADPETKSRLYGGFVVVAWVDSGEVVRVELSLGG